MNTLRMIVIALIAAGLSGCVAGIHAGEVTKGQSPDGLRYFLPSRYLVIQQTGDGQWDASIQSAVDRSREYYVQPFAILSSGAATVEFNDDGTIKSFKLVGDATAVPAAAIDAAKQIELEREKLLQEEIDAKKPKSAS